MATEQLALVDLIDEMCAGKDLELRPLKVAGDIMTKDVRTLTLDHTVNACIKLMKGLRFRHLPLVDVPYDREGEPYFVGIVSERDVLRVISASLKVPGKQDIDKRAMKQLLAQVVARNPKTVSPDTPIPEVIMTMLDNHIEMVPVLVEKEVVGIITSMDIIKIFFRFDDVVRKLYPKLSKTIGPGDFMSAASGDVEALCLWVSQTVEEIMTIQVSCLTLEDELAEAIDLMKENKFMHIPIIDELGKLQGIVSDRDVLRHLHYAGKRPMGQQENFREHLFRVEPDFVNLKLPLEQVMTHKIIHIPPGSSIYSAADTLYKSRVSCLPVIDEYNNLLGIVTLTDLMSALLAIYGEKA